MPNAIIDKDKALKKYSQTEQRIYTNLSEKIINDIDSVLSNVKERNPVKLRDNTPNILVKQGINNLPMYQNPSHIRMNILSTEEAVDKGIIIRQGDNYHGLGKKLYLETLNGLDNPRAIFKKSNDKDYIIISELNDCNGNVLIVPIEIHTTTKVNKVNINTNRIKSLYGKNNIDRYLKDNMICGNLIQIYEQKRSGVWVQYS